MYWGVSSLFNLAEAVWASNGSSHHPFFEGWVALGALAAGAASTNLSGFTSATATVSGSEMEAPVQPAVEEVFPSEYWDFASSQENTCSESPLSFGRSLEEHHISEPWKPVT